MFCHVFSGWPSRRTPRQSSAILRGLLGEETELQAPSYSIQWSETPWLLSAGSACRTDPPPIWRLTCTRITDRTTLLKVRLGPHDVFLCLDKGTVVLQWSEKRHPVTNTLAKLCGQESRGRQTIYEAVNSKLGHGGFCDSLGIRHDGNPCNTASPWDN